MKKEKGFFSGILIGSIGGILAALTLAPQSGKKLREKGKDIFGKTTDKLTQLKIATDKKLSDFKENNKEYLAGLKVKFQNFAQKTKSFLKKKKKDIEN